MLLRHSYSIRYQVIFTAIDSLRINGDYVIILLGVYLDNYNAMYGKPDNFREEERSCYYGDVEILFVDSRQSAVIVMKRSEMPYWEYVPLEYPVRGMEEIENTTHVYSNMDHLADTSFHLSLARAFKVEYEISEDFRFTIGKFE